jgi:hypothetical protein
MLCICFEVLSVFLKLADLNRMSSGSGLVHLDTGIVACVALVTDRHSYYNAANHGPATPCLYFSLTNHKSCLKMQSAAKNNRLLDFIL